MKKIQCLKCGGEWIPRTEKPIKCPRCFSIMKSNKKRNPGKTKCK